MQKEVLMVQKWDMEIVDLETAVKFHAKAEETLPLNVTSLLVPHTWEVKLINKHVVHIKLDRNIEKDLSIKFLNKVKDAIGNDFTVVTGFCNIEVIEEGQ